MMTAEQNYRLLEEIDANRRFLLLAYRSNPALQALAEESAALKWGENAPLAGVQNDEHADRLVRRPASTDFP